MTFTLTSITPIIYNIYIMKSFCFINRAVKKIVFIEFNGHFTIYMTNMTVSEATGAQSRGSP